MIAPSVQGEAAAGRESLWNRAPAWRNLVVTATFLTAAALAALILAPQEEAAPQDLAPVQVTSAVSLPPLPAAPACSLNWPAGTGGAGVVIRFLPPMQAQRRVLNNQQAIGGPINPAYALTPRIVVHTDGGDNQIVVLPPGVMARVGDRVSFDGIHRDPGSACAYIPPLLTSDAGPAAGNAAPGALPEGR
jgi:hypothetical protein